MSAKTMFDKIWESHVVREEGETTLLYVDRHLVHEVTSPQAFEGLKLAGRKIRRLGAALAVPDHNVPTTDRSQGIDDPVSALQVTTLEQNCAELGVTLFGMNDLRQGIVHVIGPEQGFTPTGHNHCLRRFSHCYPWSLWRAGLWHRHKRGGACTGYSVLAAEAAQDHGGPGRWRDF